MRASCECLPLKTPHHYPTPWGRAYHPASFFFVAVFHFLADQSRSLRAYGISTASTIIPSGSIQKPTMGRKPTIPPRQSAEPNPTRNARERGTLILKRPKRASPSGCSVIDSLIAAASLI